MVVDVGDLELAPRRRLELRDHVEHVGPVAVEARDCEPAGRDLRLLDDLGNPALLDARDPEMAQVLRLTDMREQDACSLLLPLEVPDRRRDRAAEDVVGEHDDNAVTADEVAGEAERLRNASRPLLVAVRELGSEKPPEIVDVLAARHNHQIGDSGFT